MKFSTAVLTASLLMLCPSADAQENRLSPPGSPEAQVRAPRCADCYVQMAGIRIQKDAPVVAETNPACVKQTTDEFIETLLAVVGPRVSSNTSSNLVEAAKRLPKLIYGGLVEEVGLDFRKLLAEPDALAPTASCAPLAVLLPFGAEIVDTQLVVSSPESGTDECLASRGNCPGTGDRFLYSPVPISAGGRIALATTFLNGLHDHDKTIRMFVAYRMPQTQKPLPLD